MKTKLSTLALVLFFIFNISCGKKEQTAAATWNGQATPVASSSGANVKNLSVTITSTGSPVTGTYKIDSGSGSNQGTVSGTALGLIYTIILTPAVSGTTFTLNVNWDGEDLFTGTMKSIENGVAVTYNVTLSRQ